MHCGKAQVGSTVNLCQRFNPGRPELNLGRRSNSGSDTYNLHDGYKYDIMYNDSALVSKILYSF